MAIRIGRWDCANCGRIGNLGPLINCTGCGAPRGKNVKFYLTEDAEVVTDLEKIREAKAGADWVCSHCGSGNHAMNSVCFACGNGKDTSDATLQEKRYSGNLREVAAQTLQQNDRPKEYSRSTPSFQISSITGYFNPRYLKYLLERVSIPVSILVLILSIVFTVIKIDKYNWWVNHPACYTDYEYSLDKIADHSTESRDFIHKTNTLADTIPVYVHSRSWKSEIKIETLSPVSKESDYLPSDARHVTSRQVIDHYEKVQDGYTTERVATEKKTGTREYVCGQKDLGNGYFEDEICTEDVYETVYETEKVPKYKDVPVYKTRYSYTVDEWISGPSVFLEGKNSVPVWTDPGINSKRREKNRIQTYSMEIHDEQGNILSKPADEEAWSKFKLGDILKGLKHPLNSKPFSFVFEYLSANEN